MPSLSQQPFEAPSGAPFAQVLAQSQSLHFPGVPRQKVPAAQRCSAHAAIKCQGKNFYNKFFFSRKTRFKAPKKSLFEAFSITKNMNKSGVNLTKIESLFVAHGVQEHFHGKCGGVNDAGMVEGS